MNPFTNARIVGENVPYSQYSQQACQRGDRDFVMSRGELMEFAACPHRWRMGYQSSGSKATEWGSLIDCLALQPGWFDELFAVAPEAYPDSKTGEPKPWNGNATFCKEWKSEHANKQVIKSPTMEAAHLALKRLKETAGEFLDNSRKQVMATADFKDRETELVIPLRVLIDLVPNASKCLADLKTACSADPHDWTRAVFEHNYDAQAALILDIYTAATGEDRTDFVHIVQENFEPFEVADPLPSLSAEFVDMGRQKVLSALRLYARCLKDDRWPSYSPGTRLAFGGTYFVEPDAWMVTRIGETTIGPLSLPKIEPITTPLARLSEVMP